MKNTMLTAALLALVALNLAVLLRSQARAAASTPAVGRYALSCTGAGCTILDTATGATYERGVGATTPPISGGL